MHLQLGLEDVINDVTKEIEDFPRSGALAASAEGAARLPGRPRGAARSAAGPASSNGCRTPGSLGSSASRRAASAGGRETSSNRLARSARGPGRVRRQRKIKDTGPSRGRRRAHPEAEGEGEAGEAGTPPGDLYVVVNIPEHPVFKRRDSDLFVESHVNAVDAMLGTELRVPTLYGDTMLDIPVGHSAGNPVQDQGEGAPQAELFRQGGRVRRGQS